MMRRAGFEPATFGLWAQRSTGLSYPAIVSAPLTSDQTRLPGFALTARAFHPVWNAQPPTTHFSH